MRQDMSKVIVERPRVGGNMAVKSRRQEKEKNAVLAAARDPERHDEPGRAERMKDRFGYGKTLNENLNPLRKFFRSRIGKHWNKVYSEVREHLDTGSAVKQHVADHIRDMVTLHTEIRNGVVGTIGMIGFRPVYGLYVHPVTGILCEAKDPMRSHVRVKFPKTKHPVIKHPTDPNIQYRLIDDVWYEIKLAVAPPQVPVWTPGGSTRSRYADTRFKVYEKTSDILFPGGTDAHERKIEYGSSTLCAVKKKQCGRKAIKYIREKYKP